MNSRLIATAIVLLVAATATTLPAQTQNAGDNDQNRQKIFDRLEKEINDLIPGEYAEDSPEKAALGDIVYAFMASNQSKISESLTKLIKLDPKVPPRELLLAGLAYASNSPVSGKALLEQAAIRQPDHPAIPLAFARLALVQGRYFDALACIEKTQRTNSASKLDAELKKEYELACVDSLTIIEIRRLELQSAENYARQWEALAPKSDKMFLASAEIKFLQERIDEATAYLNQRSADKQFEAPTEVIVAKWYQSKNDVVNYGKWMESAYKKTPENPVTQLEYAAWLIRREDFENAERILDEYESKNEKSMQTMLVRGRVAFAKEDFVTSQNVFTQLVQQQPGNLEHVYFLILTLLESKDTNQIQQAVQLAQRTYQAYPNNQLSMATVGWALYVAGNKEVGQELILQAKNMGQTQPDTAYFLAKTLVDGDRKAQAKIALSPFLKSPAVFVFRKRAQKLYDSLQSSDDLPDPTDN